MPNSKAAVLHGELLDLVKDYAFNGIYPVGTIYTSTRNVNPHSFFGGTWELMPSTEPNIYRFKRTA